VCEIDGKKVKKKRLPEKNELDYIGKIGKDYVDGKSKSLAICRF